MSTKIQRRDFLKIAAISMASAGLPAGYMYNRFVERFQKKKAKSVVVLFMVGGPSQIEFFDYKPELYRSAGKTVGGFHSEIGETEGEILSPISKFRQHGESGQWVSDLLPEFSQIADDITFIKSVSYGSNNHLLAQIEFHTGTTVAGNPSAGAWLSHLIGGGAIQAPHMFLMEDLLGPPRSVPLIYRTNGLAHANKSVILNGSISNFWKSLQVSNFKDPNEFQKFTKQMERIYGSDSDYDPGKKNSRIENIEFAYEFRKKLVELVHPEKILSNGNSGYGIQNPLHKNLAEQLILAKKLIELGTPYIEIFCGNEQDETSWDHHFEMSQIKHMAEKIDRPITAFIRDLKQSGLLDETIVLWGGEFGRLPTRENQNGEVKNGRGHNEKAGTVWLAGGGIKKGFTFGETDELSLNSVSDRVEMGDIWATIFHLMGADHRMAKLHEDGHSKALTRSYHRVIHEIIG